MVVGPALSMVDAAPGGRPNSKRVEARVVPDAPEVLGTITYDTATNAGFHPDVPAGSPNLNRTVGNRFNSALGGPLMMTGMVTMLTVFPASNGIGSVSLAGPPVGGNAPVIVFANASLMANQFNAVNIAGTVGPDFLGIFLGAFNGTNPLGLAGMSDMQNLGQGYHAFQAFYAAGSQTMFEVVPNRNAMLRATGDVLVPVELMDFKIQ
jgi:hypothetical protein